MRIVDWKGPAGFGLLAMAACLQAQADDRPRPGTAGTAGAEPAIEGEMAREVARDRDRFGPAIGPGEVLPPEVIGPEIDPGVHPPADFTLGAYTDRRIGMRWWNQAAPQTRVLRNVGGGGWAEIHRFGPLPDRAYAEFVDTGAVPDTEHCYRISVSDGGGPGPTYTTPARCAFTRDGRAIPVNRLQLRLRIANVPGADLDAPLEVRLQTPSWLVPSVTNWRPAGNSTWVDSTRDDFERGSDHTYDLMLDKVGELSDITMVSFAAPGDDRVCIAGFELRVDSQPAFAKTFGDTAATCAWVGGDTVAGVGHAELRASPTWAAYSPSTFVGHDGAALRSIIEAQFGHSLHGQGALRGGSVTTTRVNEDRLKVSVPIRVHDVPLLGDVDSTVHFDLVLANAGGRWTLSTENVDADSDDLLGYFLPVLGWKILYETSQRIESRLGGLRPTDASVPLEGLRPCFTTEAGLGVCFAD